MFCGHRVIGLIWSRQTRNFMFRPHRSHTLHWCGLLLEMSHVAWSVCLLGKQVSPAKTA